MDLMMGLSAISTTLEIAKELRAIDREMDRAELKLRIADLVGGLLEAKEALLDAKEERQQLLDKIEALSAKILERGRLQDENGLLFSLDDSGGRVGEPFCNLCHVREDKKFRMRHIAAKTGAHEHYRCDNCKTLVIVGPALPFLPLPPNRNKSR